MSRLSSDLQASHPTGPQLPQPSGGCRTQSRASTGQGVALGPGGGGATSQQGLPLTPRDSPAASACSPAGTQSSLSESDPERAPALPSEELWSYGGSMLVPGSGGPAGPREADLAGLTLPLLSGHFQGERGQSVPQRGPGGPGPPDLCRGRRVVLCVCRAAARSPQMLRPQPSRGEPGGQ